MNTSETLPRGFCPFVTPASMQYGTGGQIDWAKVTDYWNLGKFDVVNNGGSLKGATSMTVDALEADLPLATVLDFGEEESVTVELSGNEAIGQTAIGVVALTGALPSGAILKGGAGEFMQLTAAAAEGATSITVEALEVAWESGDTATYQGGRKLAKLTAKALAGATTLAVEALQFAIADNATGQADYSGTGDGRRISQGTVMVRLSTGLLLPRKIRPASEEACGFLASDADESLVHAKSGFGLVIGNTQIYENLCPDAVSDDLPSAYKTELASNTLGFAYTDYSNSAL